MTASVAVGLPSAASVVPLRARGLSTIAGAQVSCRHLLPTDPIGAFSLELTNLVVGSAIRVELVSTGALVAARTATFTTEAFALSAYGPGSANNNLRIKVRKGSASPFYIPWETFATAAVGTQSIYVSQIPDE